MATQRASGAGSGRPRFGHGGRRPGAGRKPNGPVAGVTHDPRPRLGRGALVVVTLALAPGLPDPRAPRFEALVRAALPPVEHFGSKVRHVTLQRDHLHLILCVDRPRSLSRAMNSLCARLARGLNRLAGRRGKVFADRYEVRELVSLRARREGLRDPCAWRGLPGASPNRPASCSAWPAEARARAGRARRA